MQELSVRCSSLPVACACAQAVRPPAVKIDTADASARVGTATHACLAGRILGEAPEDDVRLAAAAHDVDPDDVGRLVYLGWKYWRERLAEFFPRPEVEAEFKLLSGGVLLTGHADVLSHLPEPAGEHAPPVEEVRVLDWKSGWADGDHDDQIRGYCYAAVMEQPQAVRATGVVVRLREATMDVRTYERAELEVWWQRHSRAWLEREPPYKPGRWCGYCPRARECPAHARQLAHYVAAFTPTEEGRTAASLILGGLPQPLTPRAAAVALEGYARLQAVERACESAREQIRALVEAAGGTLTDGERELALLPQARREVVPSPQALGHLYHRFGTSQPVHDAMRLSLSKLTDAARERAPRGEKKQAAADLVEALDRIGAIVTTSAQRLTLRRVTPVITGETTNGNGNDPAAAAADHTRGAAGPGEAP